MLYKNKIFTIIKLKSIRFSKTIHIYALKSEKQPQSPFRPIKIHQTLLNDEECKYENKDNMKRTIERKQELTID